MTVRHIVSWKLNGETAGDRARQAQEIVDALSPLRELVPGVVALEVHVNAFNADANWDVVLVSDHVDSAALDVYATHPDHLAAAAIVKARATARAGVDFEV